LTTTMPNPSESIAGWAAIHEFVAARAPVPLSRHTILRLARRKQDPLPVKRWGGQGNGRVYAIAAELEAWCRRQAE